MKGSVLREEMRASEATEKRACLVTPLGEAEGESHPNSPQPQQEGGGLFPLQVRWSEPVALLLPSHVSILRKCNHSHSTASGPSALRIGCAEVESTSKGNRNFKFIMLQ